MTISTASAPRRSARRRKDLISFLVVLTMYVVWTGAVVADLMPAGLDSAFTHTGLTLSVGPGQAANAFALLTHPLLILLVILGLAARSLQQRQRNLAAGLGVAAIGIVFAELQRWMIARPRPHGAFAGSIAADGYAYPSAHVVAVTVLVWVVVALANANRRSIRAQRRRRALGALLISFVGVSQCAMGVAYLSDLVGGVLLGASVALAALWLSGVNAITRAWTMRTLPEVSDRRAAVIYNPTKVLDLDLFRRRVTYAMARAGWRPPIWIETRHDDPGRDMARQAIAAGVDRVLVAGGDGTARTVASEMAGTKIPLALIPAGTGNLLGRNIGISLDEDEALDAALHGEARAIDLVTWTLDGERSQFAVMAGVGLDAQIMRETNPRLKKIVKAGAYVLAGVLQARMPPFRASVTLDGECVYDGDAVMVLVGNVGRVSGGISLIPAADAEDGKLHLVLATRSGIRGLLSTALSIRRVGPTSPLRRMSGTRIEVMLDRAVAYELDGDTEGETTAFTAEVDSGAVLVMSPRQRARAASKEGLGSLSV